MHGVDQNCVQKSCLWLTEDPITYHPDKKPTFSCVPRWFYISTLVLAILVITGALAITGYITPKGDPIVSGSMSVIIGGSLLLATLYFVVKRCLDFHGRSLRVSKQTLPGGHQIDVLNFEKI